VPEVVLVGLGHQLFPLLDIRHHGALLDYAEFVLNLNVLLTLPQVFHFDAPPYGRLGLEFVAQVRSRGQKGLLEVWDAEGVVILFFPILGNRARGVSKVSG